MQPMIEAARERMGITDGAVTPENTEKVIKALNALYKKTGAGSAADLQDWFQRTKSPRIRHGEGDKAYETPLLHGDMLPAVVQLEAMDYMKRMARELFNENGQYAKQLEMKYGTGELGQDKAREEIQRQKQFILDNLEFANDAILGKYTSISGAGRMLRARSYATNSSNSFFTALKAVKQGQKEFRDAYAKAQGFSGEAAEREEREAYSKAQQESVDKVSSDSRLAKNLADLQKADPIKGVKEMEFSTADEAWREVKGDAASRHADLWNKMDQAADDLAEARRILESMEAPTKKKGAASLDGLTPEEIKKRIEAHKEHLKELVKEAIDLGVIPDARTTWFSEMVKKAIKDDPELTRLIKEYESKAPREAKQVEAIEAAFKEQVRNPSKDGSFEVFMKEKFGISDAEAKSFYDKAIEANRAIEDERAKLNRKYANENPESVARSKAFVSELVKSIMDSPATLTSNPEWRRNMAEKAFRIRGMDPAVAKEAAVKLDEVLQDVWSNALFDVAKKIQRRISKAEPKLGDIADAVKVINGLGGKSLISQWLAKAGGFQELTDRNWNELSRLDGLKDRHGDEMRAKFNKQMHDILVHTRLPKTTMELATQGFINDSLSGLGTAGKNWFQFYNFGTRLATDLGRNAIEGKTASEKADLMINSIRDMGRSISKVISRAKMAFKNEAFSQHVLEHLSNTHSMHHDMIKALEDFKDAKAKRQGGRALKALGKTVWTSSDYVRRMLASADEAWGLTMREHVTGSESLRALMKEGGMSLKDAKEILDTVRNKAPAEAETKFGKEYTEAPPEEQVAMVSAMTRDLMRSAVDDVLSEKGVMGKGKEIEDTAIYEGPFMLGNRQAEAHAKWDLPGNFLEGVKKMAQSFRGENAGGELLGRILLGYVTVPANALDRSLYFSPLGIARAMTKLKDPSSKMYGESMHTELAARQRLAEGIAGTVAMAVMAGLMSQKDDEGQGITVTGAGPKNPAEREAWLKRGHHVQSIEMRVGDTIVAIPWGNGGVESLQGPMMALGAANDMHLNGGVPKDKVEAVGAYIHSSLNNIKQSASFVAGQNNLASIFGDSEKKVWSAAAFTAAGFVPYSGLAKSVQRITQGPLDQSTISAAVGSQIPYANFFTGRPALNALGDPIRTTPTNLFSLSTEKGFANGLPIYVGIDPQSKDANLYRMFQTKGAAPSAPLFARMQADYGMSPEVYGNFLKTRGRILKASLNAKSKDLGMMKPEDFSKALTSASSKATADAAEQLNLTKRKR